MIAWTLSSVVSLRDHLKYKRKEKSTYWPMAQLVHFVFVRCRQRTGWIVLVWQWNICYFQIEANSILFICDLMSFFNDLFIFCCVYCFNNNEICVVLDVRCLISIDSGKYSAIQYIVRRTSLEFGWYVLWNCFKFEKTMPLPLFYNLKSKLKNMYFDYGKYLSWTLHYLIWDYCRALRELILRKKKKW